jgi:hypothetical protein
MAGDTKGPLRRIVSVIRHADSIYEKQTVELSCGHVARCSSRAIYRARCGKCKAERAKGQTDGR